MCVKLEYREYRQDLLILEYSASDYLSINGVCLVWPVGYRASAKDFKVSIAIDIHSFNINN